MEASLTSPLLRVSRPVSACSRCRSAKVKCDGKLPACTACERSGKAHECTGGSDQFARGKERSYVASLETRIEKLEKKLASLNKRRGSLIEIDDPTQSQRNSNRVDGGDELDSISPATRKIQKGNDDADMEDLVADLGFLQINACTRDFHGVTDKITFCALVLKASASSKSLDGKLRARLPSRHTATQLIQHYFDKIYTLMPCFSETGFFGSLDSVYRDEATASAFDCYMVYMVLGVGTMSLSRSRDSAAAHNAACFVKTALEYAHAVITPANIIGVQAALMLVQYSMLEPQHFNSWYLIGVASRILIDLGLHHEPQKNLKMKSSELELKRKIFYCVYALDRSISMVLQRPFSFSDEAVDVQLPKVNDASIPRKLSIRTSSTSMDAAVHLFKLRKQQSVWYQTLYHTGSDPSLNPIPDYIVRREKLEKWLEDIPETITKANKDWLTLEWHYLYVYASAPCPKMPQPCIEALNAIFTHCVQYALKFRRILADQNNRIVYTFHDALRTYYVGMNLLHALWHNEDVVLNEGNIGTAMDGIKATTYDADGLRDQFRQEASYMLARLQQKMDEFLTAPIPQPSPPLQSYQQPNQQDQKYTGAGGGGDAGVVGTIPSHLTAISQSALDNRLSFDFAEWPEYNAALSQLNGRNLQNGQAYNPSGHIATVDFGNVAFYGYDERSWQQDPAAAGVSAQQGTGR
ncbi:fungal-specific transcription factor domain-containing protein [Peziza echinospora]|nr:fungal-specific transcription factor domain-containing protein [Peziza echinospora]